MYFASKHPIPLIGLDLKSAVSSGENNPVGEDAAGAVVVELIILVVACDTNPHIVRSSLLYATFQ